MNEFAIELAQKLIRHPSVTTESNSPVMAEYVASLSQLGFDVNVMQYVDQQGQAKEAAEAKRPADSSPKGSVARGVGYFCHNDVVSVDGWNCSHGGPFDGVVAEDRLWGRGSCDMKGSAASALAAIARIAPEEQTSPIYFFITGDEECGMVGADVLAEKSAYFEEMVARQMVGIIGEPTNLELVNAHKGGCHLDVISQGVAAHSSTEEGLNANLQMVPFLSYLRQLHDRTQTDPDLMNDAFSPSDLSLNFVIENHPQSPNITVGKSVCRIFFRPMPETPWQRIYEEIQEQAAKLCLTCKPLRPLPPVHTPADSSAVREVLNLLGQAAPLAVCYATDGCCLQDLESLLVLGPGSIEQAHRPDEYILLEQLNRGVDVFESVFRHFAC
jgi:acetylornithine deacetylase